MKFDELMKKYKDNLVTEAVPTGMSGSFNTTSAAAQPAAPQAAAPQQAPAGQPQAPALPPIKSINDLNNIKDPKQQKAVMDTLSKALKVQGTDPASKAWSLATQLASQNPNDIVKAYNAVVQPQQAAPQAAPAGQTTNQPVTQQQ